MRSAEPCRSCLVLEQSLRRQLQLLVHQRQGLLDDEELAEVPAAKPPPTPSTKVKTREAANTAEDNDVEKLMYTTTARSSKQDKTPQSTAVQHNTTQHNLSQVQRTLTIVADYYYLGP